MQRGAPVPRRYSEFVFLFDCLCLSNSLVWLVLILYILGLIRRYPFRIIPQLPPKRVGRMYPHRLYIVLA